MLQKNPFHQVSQLVLGPNACDNNHVTCTRHRRDKKVVFPLKAF